jgi:hypothetical protein
MERIVRLLRKLALALIQDRGNRGSLRRNTEGGGGRKVENSPSTIARITVTSHLTFSGTFHNSANHKGPLLQMWKVSIIQYNPVLEHWSRHLLGREATRVFATPCLVWGCGELFMSFVPLSTSPHGVNGCNRQLQNQIELSLSRSPVVSKDIFKSYPFDKVSSKTRTLT